MCCDTSNLVKFAYVDVTTPRDTWYFFRDMTSAGFNKTNPRRKRGPRKKVTETTDLIIDNKRIS